MVFFLCAVSEVPIFYKNINHSALGAHTTPVWPHLNYKDLLLCRLGLWTTEADPFVLGNFWGSMEKRSEKCPPDRQKNYVLIHMLSIFHILLVQSLPHCVCVRVCVRMAEKILYIAPWGLGTTDQKVRNMWWNWSEMLSDYTFVQLVATVMAKVIGWGNMMWCGELEVQNKWGKIQGCLKISYISLKLLFIISAGRTGSILKGGPF